jgi:hypothetical protein
MEKKVYNVPPPKGLDIIGIDVEGDEHYVFRCNCGNQNCIQFRSSITGVN